MLNVIFFEKMHSTLRELVITSLNKTQISLRNAPFTTKDLETLPKDAFHTLLEEDQVFATVLSLVYTRMMDYASKLKNVESRRYAENFISEQFGRFSTSGIKYELAEEKKSKIRTKIRSFWKVPL